MYLLLKHCKIFMVSYSLYKWLLRCRYAPFQYLSKSSVVGKFTRLFGSKREGKYDEKRNKVCESSRQHCPFVFFLVVLFSVSKSLVTIHSNQKQCSQSMLYYDVKKSGEIPGHILISSNLKV